jgi:threonine aldolase
VSPRYDFASDNTAGAAPEAVESWVAANAGFVSGYGTDPVVRRAAELIRERLDADAEVRFLASGTAANALALAMLAQPHEAVVAHEHAHVCTDETCAPGFFGAGVGLIPLPGPSGRVLPRDLERVLEQPDHGHRQGPAALSLTQATEYGQVYSVAELRDLTATAKAAGLRVHVDGARLANAAGAGFDVSVFARSGVDVLVMGGTKAGLPLSEALVIFDHQLTRRLDARLKHAGQLVSKARFLAAPWIGMLESGAWVRRAEHANRMARRLAEGLARTPYALVHPVEANAVFVDMAEPDLERLRAAGWFVYRVIDGSVRFMCSWATTEAAVDEVVQAVSAL